MLLNAALMVQGKHPKHSGMSEAAMLGTVECYFVKIIAISSHVIMCSYRVF